MKKPKISVIAAIGRNRELGKDNKLLWHIPEDLKRFRKLTEGHVVIMGRKTFESIGRPLPHRVNIVVTRDVKKFLDYARHRDFYHTRTSPSKTGALESEKIAYAAHDLIVCSSLEEAIDLVKNSKIYDLRSLIKDEVFIIGGGQIYKQAIKFADKLYLTIIDKEFPQADTFFPEYGQFKKVVFEQKGEGGGYLWRWIELERK